MKRTPRAVAHAIDGWSPILTSERWTDVETGCFPIPKRYVGWNFRVLARDPSDEQIAMGILRKHQARTPLLGIPVREREIDQHYIAETIRIHLTREN